MVFGTLAGPTSRATHMTSEHTYLVSHLHSGAGTKVCSGAARRRSAVLGRNISTLGWTGLAPRFMARSSANSRRRWGAWSDAGLYDF